MQTVSSKIWTRVAVSISYAGNNYTTNDAVCVCVCVCVCVLCVCVCWLIVNGIFLHILRLNANNF